MKYLPLLILTCFLCQISHTQTTNNDEIVKPRGVMWVSVISDILIAIAYFAIPIEIFYFQNVYRLNLKSVLFILVLFILFISFCGITHALNIYAFFSDSWVPLGIFKVLTAIISVTTAVVLVFEIPKAAEKIQNIKEEQLRLAKQMLRYVNHELRNPLHSALGSIQIVNKILMGKSNPDKDIIECLDVADKCANLMLNIVNDVLDIGKLEEKKIALNSSELDICQLSQEVMRVIDIAQEQNEFQRKIITLRAYPEKLGTIISDGFRIKQILLNILSNAVKYANDQIMLVITRTESFVLFVVVDDGAGISPGKQDVIFTPYLASSPTDAEKYNSIGLGLYLCKMLSDLLGGKIGFKTMPGQGSLFYLAIPIDNNEIDTAQIEKYLHLQNNLQLAKTKIGQNIV